MALLNLVYAPNPVFKQKASEVAEINEEIIKIANDMVETMYYEGAVGMGANMVGVLKRIVVIDLQENGAKKPHIMINPKIITKSAELQVFEESSICFPYISAEISRPKEIEVEFQNLQGELQKISAEGFFSSVIQHEIDYLNGITFPDHLSKLKRDMLIQKMQKHVRLNPPHVHGAHCSH